MLTRDLVRAFAVGALVLLAAIWLAYYAALAHLMFQTLQMNDFGKFYYSARAFLDGQPMYAPSPATAFPLPGGRSMQLLNMNPPHFHLLVLPFARLAPLPAIVAWAIVNVACLAASIGLIGRELQWRWTLARVSAIAAIVIFCSATGTVVVTGQLSFLLMVPATLAWIALRRGRFDRAAVWLGLLASVKPFFLIFALYFLLRARVRPVVIMALAMAAVGVAGVAVFGVAAYRDWLGALSAIDWAWTPMNASLTGLASRALTHTPYFTPVVEAPALGRAIVIAGSVALLAAIARVLWRDREGAPVDRSFALLLVTALLVNPLGWLYYLFLIAGPVAALSATMRERRSVLLWLAVPGLLCPISFTVYGATHAWASVTVASLYTWTMLSLWGGLMRGVPAVHRDI